MKPKAIIVDIDSTIADLSHRLHFIEKDKPDWESFYLACDKDTPIESIINIVRSYHSKGYTIILLTGRPDYVRNKTKTWLEKYNIPYDLLDMKPNNDFRKSVFFKREVTIEYLYVYNIILAIDDELPNITMFKSLNIPVIPVEGRG